MLKRLNRRFLARVSGLLCFAGFLLPLCSQPVPGYAGSAVCSRCHAAIHKQSQSSPHTQVMQAATAATVRGNFAAGPLALGGARYSVRSAGGTYFITESELSGKPVEHRVEYTLGARRVQHYLTRLPDGRIVILPPTWDIAAGQWMSDQDVHNPEESAGTPFQVWNKSCVGCHASGERKNFDLERLTYATSWRALGVDCETCHGPGAAHAAEPKRAIVNPARLDPFASSAVCAQCHSFRDAYADGFQPGAHYYDYFLPVMEYRVPASDDPPFWADGRPRWLPNAAVGMWQSQCFLKGGATCVSCHSSGHTASVSGAAAACARCHQPESADPAAHSHHAGTGGPSCIGCHMPTVVAGAGGVLHDHSMSIPAPENTARHEIPNACNLCHRDRDSAWAEGQMAAWWPGARRRRAVLRADTFTAARKGDAGAVPALLRMTGDASAGGWIRANAIGYLGAFPNEPSAYEAVLRAFGDSDPVVRATAAAALRPRAGQRPAAAQALLPLLADASPTVRVTAATALVGMGVQPFPGADGARFERAKALYAARAALFPDDAGQQYAAGQFAYLAGNAEAAVAAFRAVLKLDPAIPVRYDLARALAKKGDYPAARDVLSGIAPADPQYARAQALLGEVAAKSPADGLFAEAEGLVKSEYFAAALAKLDEALRLGPAAPWAERAQVDRAICLAKLSRTAEAEAAFRNLAAQPGAAHTSELQLAYVELLFDTGRTEEALRRADAALAAAPNLALAQFWRAKLLLQLRRLPEAATAAEEAAKLTPDEPQPHNLLIRIYQLQGRAQDAAREAAWLRDYERRAKSR